MVNEPITESQLDSPRSFPGVEQDRTWERREIGPLQLAIHVVQNGRAGEQKSLWDKTNKENYSSKLCMSFVCLVPVRLLLSGVAVLYHVSG